MRFYRWLSLLTALCLLCAAIPAGLAEEDIVSAAENADGLPCPDEEPAELTGEIALFEPGDDERPDEAAPADVIPNAGGSEVPLKDYNFPDASFREYLEKNVDKDGNRALSDAEISGVGSLDLRGLPITDLKGIEFFPALRGLDCSGCLLSALDLRGNPGLSTLDCSNNRLETLDVSNCESLAQLNCSKNKLSLMRFPEDSSLMVLMCQENALTTLDLGVLSPDARPTVVEAVAATDTPLRIGDEGSASIGDAFRCVVCDNYIELTLNGKVLRSLTAKRIEYECSDFDMEVRQTRQLQPAILPAEAKVPLYYAVAAETEFLTVTKDGLITGVKPGRAAIMVCTEADCSPQSQIHTIYVTVRHPSPVSVTLQYHRIEVGVGETVVLKYTLSPSDAQTAPVYYCENQKLATLVKKEGQQIGIKGRKIGTTTVTVTTHNDKSDTCQVVVKAAPKSIKLDKKGTVKLGVGNRLMLQTTVEPKNSATLLKWTSSKPSVATVQRGVVTAVKKGTTKITVETFNGKTASVKIKVVDPTPTEIYLDSRAAKLNIGETMLLKATIKPDNAKDKTVKWSSSNKKVASVTKDGLVVARKKGTAVITARTSNGLKAKCKVKVVAPKPTGIQIVRTKTTMKVKKTLKLKATLSPAHAEAKLSWSSSNKDIAKVNSKGEVKARKKGTVTITVRTDNGLSDSIDITVK